MIFKTSSVLKFALCCLLLCFPLMAFGQNSEPIMITAESLSDGKTIALDKTVWKYQRGDDSAWAAKDYDDSSWEQIQESRINLQSLPASGWNGRAWFRLRFRVDESATDKTFSLIAQQSGASEVYLNGRLLAKFGKIYEYGESEYNPNNLPVPFRFDAPGEQVFAVRFSTSVLGDYSDSRTAWLVRGGARPGFTFALKETEDVARTIHQYAAQTSMRPGVFFFGVLLALAFLHFLLFVFYRAERANLFYSFYAAAFAVNILCGNLLSQGHLGTFPRTVTSLVGTTMTNISFVALISFLHVAFRRRFGVIFWLIAALCVANVIVSFILLGRMSWFALVSGAAIFATISYSIFLLVSANYEKLPGAWILLGGMQTFALGMTVILLRQLGILPQWELISFFSEIFVLLGIPVAVSIFLARNFARTNRELKDNLDEVKRLSEQQIEQERQSAELRAENERRAKELEEARQLQLSLLPKKLPQTQNLEVAAYMKPATEVGGDYYDFYLAADQTLTIAVGDATGHGLKAGTMVTATKSLFNNLAPEPILPEILKNASIALKKMNLRGMFMALTMARIGGNRLQICQAGMPPALIFRRQTGVVEEFESKALPLGAPLAKSYVQQETGLEPGDCLLIMSDGFPEMFNKQDEMIGFERAAEILRDTAHLTATEIVQTFVAAGEKWAGSRPADDDVTFVAVKILEESF